MTFIVSCTHFIKFFRGLAFYVLLAVTGAIVVLFPIGNRWAVFVLIDFITKDLQKVIFIQAINHLGPFILLFSQFSALYDIVIYGIDWCNRRNGNLANETF